MRMRSSKLVLGLVLAVTLACTGATAQSDAVTRANRMAYDLAIKCFVANGFARGDNLDAGDQATAAVFEAGARKSFDIAGKLGDVLGYSGNQQNEDFGMAQTRELAKFVQDKSYLKKTLATCKAAGLL
jgi:hypothetical protein